MLSDCERGYTGLVFRCPCVAKQKQPMAKMS